MFRLSKNEKGTIFPIAIALLFFVTTFVLTYCMSYEMHFRTYNALENVNVRATINLLGQILSDSVES
ncbi:hypothetical protein AEA09_05585 [Lysinibacillus contaminans]|uniref:Uncharacterized protein n=1 Tax=Lysinibacillus contaminans TaxID=1293441 RepID=A0ABR5JZI6_9BACI|nr:hypothetical protein AEA09_05585 [Lysinibacillus contaminans]